MYYLRLLFPNFLIILFFCSPRLAKAQCYRSIQKSLGGPSSDIAYDIVDAGNNELYMVGATSSFGAGGYDILITKLNAAREIIWSKTYGGSGDESVRRANKTPDGGLVLTGQTKSYTNGNGDILCLKINTDGSIAWQRKLGVGSTYGDLGMEIIQTTDGGYAVSGIVNVRGSIADMVVIRLDVNGNLVWGKRFDSQQGEDGVGILQVSDTLVVTADLDNNGSDYESMIMKLKMTDGSFISAKKLIPGSRGIFNPYIFKDNSNGYWISGHTIDGYSYAQMQQVILKVDVNFNITRTYGLKVNGIYTNDSYTGFVPRNDGFMTCASTQANPSGYFFYIKNDGSVSQSKKFSGSNERTLYKLADINNKIIAVGRDNSSSGNDLFITEFGEDGFIDSKCHPDTALVAVSSPDFTTGNFTWPSITDIGFTNIQANLVSAEVILSQKILCDKCMPLVAFTAPDTVCVNTPVPIKNLTTGGTTSFWNFCVSSINATPAATNLGNIGGLLQKPVFVDNVFQNGNYYGFVVNNDPGNLVRLDFGNSLLNTPTATDLGNFGGIIPRTAEGIQVVETNGKWQAIIVGGTTLSGTTPRILKIDFGTFLNNPNPVATNWGNIGNMDQPIDLYLFTDQNKWYGFTVNSSNNSITRFDFGSDFNIPPVAINLGGFGSLNYPTGIYTSLDNGFWRVFVTNGQSNSITRLDFGNSLLNNAVAVNLGPLSNTLSAPRDIYITKLCNEAVGFVVNGSNSTLVKLNFRNGLSNPPTATSLGNTGNLNFPHSISQLFRVGADIYSLVPNVDNNTLTRLQFKGCTDINIANSADSVPPSISYTKAGTYNINLMADEGLSTQASFCKTIVVLPPPPKTATIDTAFCAGDSILLKSNFPSGINLWSTGSNNNSITVKNPGTYWVQANRYGCSERDTVIILRNELPFVKLGRDTSLCKGDSLQLDAGNRGSQYLWQDGSTIQTLIAKTSKIFSVRVTDENGCLNKDSITININAAPAFQLTNDTTICEGKNIQLAASGDNISSYNWTPDPGLSNLSVFNPVATPQRSTKYYITVIDDIGCKNRDSVLVSVAPLPVVKTLADAEICKGSSIRLVTTGAGSYTYHWSPGSNLSNASAQNPVATPLSNTQYTVTAENDFGCTSATTVNISVKSLPLITAYGDTTICSAASVQLSAISPGNAVFNWTPNTNLSNPTLSNPLASPLQTTTYHVMVTGNNNCTAKDSVMIKVFPKPLFTINPVESRICKGDFAVLSASGGDQYEWSPASTVLNPTSASSKVFPLTDTRYSVIITDSKCNVSEKLEAIVAILPKAEITITKSNDLNCVLGQATLSAYGGIKYQWEPISNLSTPGLASTVAYPSVTTMYYLKSTGSNGCVSKDSIELKVDKMNDKNSYQLPGAFTPNNDGVNDCFGVKKWGYITNLQLSIFNRWGERVFFTTDAANCWNGLYKGIPQDSGAFVYIVKARGICGDINRKGTFVLIR